MSRKKAIAKAKKPPNEERYKRLTERLLEWGTPATSFLDAVSLIELAWQGIEDDIANGQPIRRRLMEKAIDDARQVPLGLNVWLNSLPDCCYGFTGKVREQAYGRWNEDYLRSISRRERQRGEAGLATSSA